MVSATRRLSVSLEDVQRRVDPEQSERRGLLGGPFGKWLEDELDYQRNMLPGIDNMWLLLEKDSDFNPVCASIYTFAEEPSYEGLLKTWDDMTKRFPVYRQRVTGLHRRFHTVRMRGDPTFDIRNHVSQKRLPPGANGKVALEDAMAAFIAKDWDLSRPLWEVKVLYGYEDGTGAKAALIARAHHTLSDGQGFVLSQLSTTSAREVIEKKLKKAAEIERELETGSGAKISDLPIPAFKPYLRPLDPFIPSICVTLLFWGLYVVFAVIALFYGTYAAVRAATMFLTFRRRALQYPGPRPDAKEFSFSEAISLKDIKLVQKAFTTPLRRLTLNDVMCGVEAKAIRAYLEAKGEPIDERIALFIPISLRAPSDQTMGNQSTGMIAYFRTDPAWSTPTLLAAAHDEMQKLKTSFWPRVSFTLLEQLTRTPALFPSSTSALIESALTSFHGVLTNVPGPQEPIDVDGTKVLGWTASPPQAGKGTLGLGMISYNGHLVWTVTADKTDSHQGIARHLTKAFYDTFNEILEEARELVKED